MAIRTIRCRQVRQSGGTIYARWSDKSENEFPNRAAIREFIQTHLTIDAMKAIALAHVLEDAAEGTALSLCDRKRVTLDVKSATPLVIQETLT